MLSRGASVKNCLHTRGMLSTRSSSAILRHRGSLIAGRNSSPFYFFFFSFRHSHRICYDQSETVYSTIAYIYKKHLFLSICIYANFFDYDIFFLVGPILQLLGACCERRRLRFDYLLASMSSNDTLFCFSARENKNGKREKKYGFRVWPR